MKFKNLLLGKKFVWKGMLFIKLKEPVTESCKWSSTGTRSLNSVQLAGRDAGEFYGFNLKSTENSFTQIKD